MIDKTKIEKQIRESVNKDTHNREFVIKFNLALVELENDPYGMSTFAMAIMPILKQFAKQNKKTLRAFIDDLIKVDKSMVNRFGESELMFMKGGNVE